MRIGIIGAGHVGGTLGQGWAKKGHQVCFGVRHPRDKKTQQLTHSINARAGTVAEAAAFAEVIVLATRWQAAEAAIRAAGDLTVGQPSSQFGRWRAAGRGLRNS